MRTRDPRRDAGYAALWVLIVIALLLLGGFAFASMDPDTVIPVFWMVACVAVAAIGLVVEARRDMYDFCKFGGTFALIGALGAGLVAGLADGSHPVALASAVVLGAAAIAALVATYRMTHAEEVLPNPLLEIFQPSELRELGGVQFGATHSDLEVPAGGEFVVQVHAQNGMDEERTLEIRLKPRADIGKRGHLAFDKVARMPLPAGAAGTLTIPVAVHPKARGKYPITVEPRVKGSGGHRLRVFRATQFSQKVGGGLQLLALFGGVFVWGGGMTLNLKVAKNKQWKSMPVEEPSPSQAKHFYVPDRAELYGIRSRL